MLLLALVLAATSDVPKAENLSPTLPPGQSILVAQGAALGEQASARLTAKAVELVEGELARSGMVVMSLADEAQLRQGAAAALPDLAGARAALERGKELYLNLDFTGAVERLALARAAFEAALPQTGDFQPVAESLAYVAASELGAKNPTAAQQAFLDLLRRRPDFALDPRIYPPDVLDGFAKAKASLAGLRRGALSISSVPPLASAIIDGVPRGKTPLSVSDLLPGPHAVRLDLAGHRAWWGVVDVAGAGASTDREVHLEANTAGDALRAFEADLQGDGDLAKTQRDAAVLAAVSGKDLIVGVALFRVDADQLTLAVGALDAHGASRVAWTTLDGDLLRGQAAAQAVVQSVLQSAGPAYVDIGVPHTALEPDFAHRLLGFPLLANPPASGATAAASPIYTRWWFWTGVGLVVAGAGVGTYALATQHGSTTVVQQPNTTSVQIQVNP